MENNMTKPTQQAQGKQVILTGFRANNDLQLGNYLGAMLPMIHLQKQYADTHQINMFVPDLHSFTTPIDHSKLYEQSINNLRLFVAAGLDLKSPDTHIYRQSHVPAHAELTVILNCFTYFGELSRMVEFKEKAEKQANVSVGLFDYPVLMTADILLYGATHIPLGDDQRQHIELARDIALRMNNKFGELFVVPVPFKEQAEFFGAKNALRIMDLQTPTKKMSKSDDSGKGVIFLGDSPDEAVAKVMAATTDSEGVINYDKTNQPGVTNLLEILSALSSTPLKEVIAKYEGETQYGPLKQDVAEAVKKFLTDFQAKLTNVDDEAIMTKLEASEQAMNEVANKTLHKVQKAIGLR